MDELIKLEDEQQVQFERIEASVGSESLAVFCCCAAFDVPFFPNLIPTGEKDEKWLKYKQNLRFKKGKTWQSKGFKDGITDVLKIFGDEVDGADVSKIVQSERKKTKQAVEVGNHDQVRTWGVGSPEEPFTKEDYDRLDDIFQTMSDRLISAGGMDVQQEDTLRQTSIMRLMRDKFILAGDKDSIAKAAQLDRMIKENLSAEQLRKADAKPVEDVRIDSIVDALEKWGAVENGKILSFPELTEFLLKQLGRLGGVPAHKYSQTLDAADYELWFIRNCMAQNEDLPKTSEIEDNMRFPEEVAHEFSAEPSNDEKRAYEGIGIVRSRTPGKKKSEG